MCDFYPALVYGFFDLEGVCVSFFFSFVYCFGFDFFWDE